MRAARVPQPCADSVHTSFNLADQNVIWPIDPTYVEAFLNQYRDPDVSLSKLEAAGVPEDILSIYRAQERPNVIRIAQTDIKHQYNQRITDTSHNEISFYDNAVKEAAAKTKKFEAATRLPCHTDHHGICKNTDKAVLEAQLTFRQVIGIITKAVPMQILDSFCRQSLTPTPSILNKYLVAGHSVVTGQAGRLYCEAEPSLRMHESKLSAAWQL